ncbi:hypothetical protein KKH36_01430 [Patescibacteria group bacterium]|nr:hypothetical protein [Patescibacteria group bacterium]
MDLEDKKIIRENLEIAKENQQMIKKMRRSMFLSSLTRVIYWVIIIGASFGAYYFFQPYLDMAKDTYGQIQSGAEVVTGGVTTTTQNTTQAVTSFLDFFKDLADF